MSYQSIKDPFFLCGLLSMITRSKYPHYPSVVTAAGKRSAYDLQKAQLLFTDPAVRVELLWSHKPIHAQVFGAR